MDTSGFNFDVPIARMTEAGYRLFAAVPLLVLSLLLIWLAWLVGNWVSHRAWFDRIGGRNTFLRELARSTIW